MSEKLKEFIEIPQEFVKDGQQVRPYLYIRGFQLTSMILSTSVPHPVHKTIAKRLHTTVTATSVL